MSETIGFIGLGKLGLPLAANLLDAGHALRVYNRTASKADALVARGATLAKSPVEAVAAGGIVISILWDDASVESLVDSAFLERLGSGGLHVAMTTISPEAARRLAALHAKAGCAYLEAPVFGRPEAAVARKLWIPMAGSKAAKERGRPLLEAMGGQGLFDFGEAVGAATVVKLAGNFLIVSAARALGEALSMAEKQGVDPKAVVEMLTTTLFSAPIYQSYGKMIVEKKAPISQSPISIKDVGLFRDAAAQVGSPSPLANQLSDLMRS